MNQKQIHIDVIDELPRSFDKNGFYLGIILASMKRERDSYTKPDLELSDIISELETVINSIEEWLNG